MSDINWDATNRQLTQDAWWSLKEIIILETCKMKPYQIPNQQDSTDISPTLDSPRGCRRIWFPQFSSSGPPPTPPPLRSLHWFSRTESFVSLFCTPSVTEHVALHYDFMYPCLFPPPACELPGNHVLFISVSSPCRVANIEWYRISISNITDEWMSVWIDE